MGQIKIKIKIIITTRKRKVLVFFLDLAEVDPDLDQYSRNLIDEYTTERTETRLEEEAKKRQKEQEELERKHHLELEEKKKKMLLMNSGRPLSEKLFTFLPPKVPEHLPDAENSRAVLRSGWDRRFDEMDDMLRTAHKFS